jgi:hypothetical protein
MATLISAFIAISLASTYVPIELTLPDVPSEMTDPTTRADYVALHFWDNLNFKTISSPDDDLSIEQNFVNFADLFNYTSIEGEKKSIEKLYLSANTNKKALIILNELAEKYFHDTASPMYNESIFINFLSEIVKSKSLNDSEKLRYEWLLQSCLKNSPGEVSADITFTSYDGNTLTLHNSYSTPYALLLLHDHDCDNCHQLIALLRNNEDLNHLISENILTVIAIDIAESTIANDEYIPNNWISGYDEGTAIENEDYIIPATPSCYLLDAERKVLIKDATTEELISFFNSLK